MPPIRAVVASLLVLGAMAAPCRAASSHQDGSSSAIAFVPVGDAATVRPKPVPAAESTSGPLQGLRRAALFAVRPATDGPLTVTLTSAHADVALRLLDADHGVAAADDDGDLGWDSRLVVEATRGATLVFVAGFKQGVEGECTFRVRAGAVPPPSGLEATLALVDRLEERAEASLARAGAHDAADPAAATAARLDAARRLHEAGTLAYDAGLYGRCERLYARMSPLVEGRHLLLETVSQGWRGASLAQRRRFTAAAPLLDRAIASSARLRESASPPEHVGGLQIEMFCRAARAEMAFEQGRHGDALADFDRALEVAREIPNRGNEAVLLAQRALVSEALGDRRRADADLERAVRIAEEVGDGERLASVLRRKSDLLMRRGDHVAARECLLPALEQQVTARTQAAVLGSLANIAWATTDILLAQELYDEALRVFRRLGDGADEAAALVALARCHEALGERAAVRRHLLEVVPLVEAMDDGRGKAQLLREVAALRLALGDYADARRDVEEASRLADVAGDEETSRHCLSIEVVLAFREQRFEEGHDLARALERATRGRGPDRESVAANALAAFELRLGRLDEARRQAERALLLAREAEDLDALEHALLTTCLVAAVRRDLDTWADALAESDGLFARLGIDRLEPGRAAIVRSEFEHWSRLSQDFVAAALSAWEADDPRRREAVRDGFERAGFWKGRSLLHGIAEHRSGLRSADVMDQRRRLGEATATRAAVLRELASARRAGAGRRRLDELEARRAAAQEAVARALEEMPAAQGELLIPSGVPPQVVSDVLGDRVMVEFTEGEEAVYAYLLRDGRLTFREVGARDELLADVEAFVGMISDPETLGTVQQVAASGERLHDLLLADVPEGAELLVVPTPALSALPFEALVTGAPEEPLRFLEVDFVVDEHEVSYVPSAPVFVQLARGDASRRFRGPALIIGDPAYGVGARPGGSTDAARSSGRPQDWPLLPGTREEALDVARVMASAWSGDGREVGAEPAGEDRDVTLETPAYSLRLGGAASPAVVSEDLRRYEIIHCASHGWADLEDPLASGLALSPSGGDDGYLSVADILGLDVDAELAVLSACRTGRGAVLGGEGVQSVARAFLFAGARSVVASLWPVDDRETGVVMRRFYTTLLRQGASPENALREARIAVRRAEGGEGAFLAVGRGRPVSRVPLAIEARVGHPYFWAPFVYVGAPRD